MESPDQPWLPGLLARVIGAWLTILLTGVLTMQVYFYYRLYPRDRMFCKITVLFVWIVGLVHTALTCVGNWQAIVAQIVHGDEGPGADKMAWPIAVTIMSTDVTIRAVSLFFGHRLYLLSGRKKIIVAPLILVSLGSMVVTFVAAVSIAKEISFAKFSNEHPYLISVALIGSALVDIYITAGLMYFLRVNRSDCLSTRELVDKLTRYTLHTGAVPCVTAIISAIALATMPHNVVFLGLSSTLGMIYANSLVASLNSRIIIRSLNKAIHEVHMSPFRAANDKIVLKPVLSKLPGSSQERPRSNVKTSLVAYVDQRLSVNTPGEYAVEYMLDESLELSDDIFQDFGKPDAGPPPAKEL